MQQTKQAFYFSLGFYLLALLLKVLSFPFADVLVSIALFLSLVWLFLVLREIILSGRLTTIERILLLVFVVFGNIVAGIVYFFFLRERVLGESIKK